MDRQRVLFLCAHNAARSQMAEALLRNFAPSRFEVISAGLAPTEVHPLTRRVLEEIGIETTMLRAKGIDEYLAKATVHYAVVVCETTQAQCPKLYPFAQHTLYWPFEDPTLVTDSPETAISKFREVRDQIAERLREWLRQS